MCAITGNMIPVHMPTCRATELHPQGHALLRWSVFAHMHVGLCWRGF